MVRVRSALVAWLLRALVIALLPPTHGDVIFRVPEVSIPSARKAICHRPETCRRQEVSVHNNVRPIAGSKAVGIGPSNASGVAAARWPEPALQYEEYFVEHDVSAADARKAAELLNLDDIPATRVGCGPCSRREMEYCESRVLSDHCCCERQFIPDPFPWLPHTCYVGPHRCRPLAHDCVKYARLRDCCCYKKLAERWRGVLSGAGGGRGGAALVLLAALVRALAA